ncbi:MAG TPA: PaaI family thioesterase [Mycobacteriales bacterium]|nr:PaaI family thioesterase [Mycobacteriales bacterium]
MAEFITHPIAGAIPVSANSRRYAELLPALERLGQAARDVVDAVVSTVIDAEEADAIARDLSAIAARLQEHAHDDWVLVTDDLMGQRAPLNPVTGSVNPWAMPMKVSVLEDKSVLGEVTLRRVHEGPPGWVHGGISALLLDQILGHATAAAGHPAMTAGLNLRYKRPTPYGEPLRITAEFTGTEGRKILAAGRIMAADGSVCVEATGVFLQPREHTRAEYFPNTEGPITGDVS